jgi:phage repressor protein C with HTH and peptisase S24 domain
LQNIIENKVINILQMEKKGESLKNLLKGKGFEINEIADRLKMSRQNLGYHFRKDVIDENFRVKLVKTFPDVFTNVKEEAPPHADSDTNLPTANTYKKGVPYYDVDFMGGFDLVFNDQAIQPSFYIDFLPFNDCDCWINVSGKSMGPLIAHGDIVGLKIVDNWKRFLLEGEIYAVITDNGFRTIKMLGAGPDKDHYTLIPYNKSEEYKPQVIPKDVITNIFRVKGNIKKFF